MPFDGFVIGAVAKELKTKLTGGKIEKIYQPSRDELLFHINVPPMNMSSESRQRYDLLISSNSSLPRIYLTELRQGNPQNPPAFCMLLRKHLLNGRILSVSQINEERIVRIDISSRNELGFTESKVLLFELMGKHSNIILLEPTEKGDINNAKILDSIKRVTEDMSRARQILPGMLYQLPPPSKRFSPIIEEELDSGKSIEEFREIANAGSYSPSLYLDNNDKIIDFHVFEIGAYEGVKAEEFSDISELIETYYERKDSGNRLLQKTADLSQTLKLRLDKALLKKQRLLEDIARAEKAEQYKDKGELITANIYMLKKGMSEALLTDYTKPLSDGSNSFKEVKVTLDTRSTPAQNAQRYFKKYNKAKTAQVAKKEQLEITEQEIDFLESYQVYIENSTTDSEVDEIREELSTLGYIRRRKNTPRKSSIAPAPLKYESTTGATIFVGRNNRENDALTFKKAGSTDLWFHTKDIPGSHVILVRNPEQGNTHSHNPFDDFDEKSIREAAETAAFYSKAKNSANVPVDYTLVKHVKKPSGAKPGMVIFVNNKTIYVNPSTPQKKA